MNVLIAGVSGTIGSCLAQSLISFGIDVTGLCRTIPLETIPGVTYIKVDLANQTLSFPDVTKFDSIVCAIGSTYPGNTSILDTVFADLELQSVLHFAHHCAEKKVHQFIYLSSGGAIYGEPSVKKPIQEDTFCRPISSYGALKHITEQTLMFLQRQHDLPLLTLRISNPYGFNKHKKKQGIPNVAMKILLSDCPHISIYGDGNMIRDFIHIQDMNEVVFQSINANLTGVFNVGSGKGCSIEDVLQMIEKIVGKSFIRDYQKHRDCDPTYNVLDISRIQKILQWTPQTEIFDGLQSQYQSYCLSKLESNP